MSSTSSTTRQNPHDVPEERRPPPAYIKVKRPPPGSINMTLPQDEAVEYLKSEILNWFDAHKTDDKPDLNSESKPKPDAKIPWYIPQIKGVRLSAAIAHQVGFVNEYFRCNPYKIGASWFWVIVMVSFIFSCGHLMVGTYEAYELERRGSRRSFLALTKGFLNGLPVVWMLLAFCFPALIANLREQLRAVGIEVDVDV